MREGWQLVMVCDIDEGTRNHLVHLARESGIDTRLLLTGFVPDAVLRLLYQSTDLFVFPSLYEGFGLPVAEALACGARVIGSATSAVAELLVPAAQFDPADDQAIATSVEHALTNDGMHALLDEQARRALPGWDVVANRTAEAYERVLGRSRLPGRRRPLVAVVTPLPPARAESPTTAFDSLRRCASTVICTRSPTGPATSTPGSDRRARPTASPCSRCSAWSTTNGLVAATTASSTASATASSTPALAQLRRRSGVVLAHEVRLTDLYALAADEPDAVPGDFAECLAGMYDGLPPGTGAAGRLTSEEADRIGVLMVAEVMALADRFIVMSEFAAERVRLDVGPEPAQRIGVVPFAIPDPVDNPAPPAARQPIVASFGVVNEVKQNSLLVAALPALLARRPDASVAFVGPCSESDREHLTALATALGVGERVVITGAVSATEYASWLDRAAVAVQLRRTTNGESSATVGDCLAAGVAVIVTRIGAARDLPDDAVVGVHPSVSAGDLASVIGDLLADTERRRGPRREAARLREHRFSVVARQLFADIIEPATVAGLSVARLS